VSAAANALVLTRRNLLQARGNPQLIVFTAVTPILFVLLFVFVFGGAIAGPSRDYVQYVIPGIIVQTVTFGTALTGLSINQDVARGIVDRFRSMPIARSAVLAGRILADAVRAAVTVVVILAVAVPLGFRLGSGPLAGLAAVALAVAFGVALSWVAATVGLVVRNPETAQAAGFLWMFPLTFASSAYAPAATMPGWLQPFVEANPISVTSDALRALLTGGPARTPVLWSLAWIAGLVLVFAPLAVGRYRRLA
jgi:oleandomycin transport system permease protein